MASKTNRSELVAEIPELHKLQLESFAKATFGGWTREQGIAHEERSHRISVLQCELNALDADRSQAA
jgi:hypothetical protein